MVLPLSHFFFPFFSLFPVFPLLSPLRPFDIFLIILNVMTFARVMRVFVSNEDECGMNAPEPRRRASRMPILHTSVESVPCASVGWDWVTTLAMSGQGNDEHKEHR